MSKTKPLQVFKCGRATVAIWRNDAPDGNQSFSMKFGRLWKDGEKWKTSASFYLDDLGPMIELAHTARDWVMGQGLEASASDEPKGDAA